MLIYSIYEGRSGSCILIAYDGSECSDVVLEDLNRAGLPHKAEVLVLSVIDTWSPEESADMTHGEHISNIAKEIRTFVQKAVKKVQRNFPNWKVHTDTHRHRLFFKERRSGKPILL